MSESKAGDYDRVIDNFIRILNTNGDLPYYEAIIQEYERIDREERGITEVEITTAGNVTISKETIQALNKAVDGDIELREKVDESLIGGVIVKIEDTMIDASLKGQLKHLKDKLSQ
jgi:F-type H+-transporting ATPase subunit delta